jgi:hypothetical protein
MMKQYKDENGALVEVTQGLDGYWIAARTSNGGKSHHRVKSKSLPPMKTRENAQELLDEYAKHKRWQTLITPEEDDSETEAELVRETRLPATVANAVATAPEDIDVSDVPEPHRKSVIGVLAVHARMTEHLRQFAVTTVQLGLMLQKIRTEVGHGRWNKFFREHLERPGLSKSQEENCRAVAEQVRIRAVATGKLAGTNAQARDVLLDNQETLLAAMGEVCSAETWRDLWQGLGMMRQTLPRGGNHGGAEARSLIAQNPNAARQVHALKWADDRIRELREMILKNNVHAYLTPPVREELRLTMYDCMQRIKEASTS